MEVMDVVEVRKVFLEDEVENDSVGDAPESSGWNREEVDDRYFEGFGGGVGAERAAAAAAARALATAVA